MTDKEIQNPSPNSSVGQKESDSRAPFQCNICQRSYSRVDHLARHFRSHTREKPYMCKRCSKSFTRLDLLKRHGQIHAEQPSQPDHENEIYGLARVSRACKSCAVAKMRCKEEKPCQRCHVKGITCQYTEVEDALGNSNGRSVSQVDVSRQEKVSSNNGEGKSGQEETSRALKDYTVSPIGMHTSTRTSPQPTFGHLNINTTEEGKHFNEAHFLTAAKATEAPVVSADDNDNTFAEFLMDIMQPTVSEVLGKEPQDPWSSRDLLAFGLEAELELNGSDYEFMDFYQEDALVEPETGMNQWMTFVDLPLSETENPSQPSAKTLALGKEAFQKSLWCWIPSRQENGHGEQSNYTMHPQGMVNLQRHFPSSMRVVSQQLGAEIRDQIVAMVLGICVRSNFTKVMSSFPRAELLDNLMQCYLASHLAQSDTWIHLPTLWLKSKGPEFVSSLVSAGALLSTSITLRKLGFALHETLAVSIPKSVEANNSLTRDLGCLQALVLNLDIGLWSGNKRKMEIAESAANAVITMMRRAGRFLRSSYRTIIPLPTDEDAVLENKWREWAEQEAFKRLVFHVFIRDAQTSISLLINPLISYAELLLPLPECRKLWLAKTSNEWKAIYLSIQPKSSNRLPSLIQCIHDTSPLISFQDRIDFQFCTSIVSYGIWGLILEYRRLHSVQTAHASANLDKGILIMGYRHQELCQLLHNFRLRVPEWSNTSGMQSQSKLVTELLLMHLHMSFNDLQLFAGKEGEEEARRVYPELQQWVKSQDARPAIWHAGQVFYAAKQLHSQELREFNAVAVYHASLAFWAYGILSMPSQSEAPASNSMDREGLVRLDGEETPQVKKFIALNRGVPCISRRTSTGRGIIGEIETVRLSEPDEVMNVMLGILRGDTYGQGNVAVLPSPLLETLIQLMRELGSAARAVISR